MSPLQSPKSPTDVRLGSSARTQEDLRSPDQRNAVMIVDQEKQAHIASESSPDQEVNTVERSAEKVTEEIIDTLIHEVEDGTRFYSSIIL